MRIRFRLHQLLTRQGIVGHGRISLVSEATGIERHKLSKLLEESEDKISLKALAEICRFLIVKGVDPRELPGALFEIEPSQFLTLLRQTPTLRTCFGVRQRRKDSSSPWAAGADSYLHGKMLELLLRPEPAPVLEAVVSTSPAARRAALDHEAALRSQRWLSYSEIQHFHQEQVHALTGPLPNDPDERDRELRLLREDAERVDQILHALPPGRADNTAETRVKHTALLLGSIKSNPVCEIATARVFGAVPWQPHGLRPDQVEQSRGTMQLPRRPQDRAVPFFLRYRDDPQRGFRDVMIPSCHAGLTLCQQKVACGRNSTVPGVYFETDDGSWDWAPWSDTEDAAIVLFDYDRLLGNVELVMGGFSSRATLLLGDHLEQIVDHLLPAPFETTSRAVGVFIIRFRVAREGADVSGPHRAPPCERPPEIIPLAQQTLARRLQS